MEEPAANLMAALVEAVPRWVERCVTAYRPDLGAAAREAGVAAAAEVAERLSLLFDLDVAEQRLNPLAIIRDAVAYPTAVLHEAGVSPISRDEFVSSHFPADHYGLAPSTWSDVDPSLHEPGIVWGAWKASTILRRRRSANDE